MNASTSLTLMTQIESKRSVTREVFAATDTVENRKKIEIGII